MPTQDQIINAIHQAAARNGANPDLMVATARVESGLRPNAVGDGGTSFGLFQNHINGAGGPTLASARQYLNWRTSIENAGRRFAGAQTPADAYSVQRPADRAGYIAKLQAAMRGGTARLNAPITGGGGGGGFGSPPAPAEPDPIIAGMLSNLNPVVAGLLSQGDAPAPAPPGPTSRFGAPPPGVGGGGAPVKVGNFAGKDYRWLQRMGQQKFGLRNDPGNGQLNGGRHTAGSEHYENRAIDWGTALNTEAQLSAWERWARAQGMDVLNEGDHRHTSFPGGGI